MTDQEATLRYWLANEDWYPSRFTQSFLDNTPPDEVRDTLARIAADAEPEPHSYAALLYTAFATAGFLPSAGGKIPRRKAGVRAALLLAKLRDARCVAPLVRVFEVHGIWQNKYQKEIVSSLTRFLAYDSQILEEPDLESVESLVERLWKQLSHKALIPDIDRLFQTALVFLIRTKPDSKVLAVIQQDSSTSPRLGTVARLFLDNQQVPR